MEINVGRKQHNAALKYVFDVISLEYFGSVKSLFVTKMFFVYLADFYTYL